MEKRLAPPSKGKQIREYIIVAIGIAFMLFFGKIPAPAPMTQAGMFLIGNFIGLIILTSFVDLVWPNFLAIALFGVQCAMQVYPNTGMKNGVHIAEMYSMGYYIVLFVLWILIVTIALEESGLIRRIALWIVTRKIAKKGAWSFSFMLLFATLFLGMFIDVVPIQVLMLSIAYEIFEALGYEKQERWPKIMVVGITFAAVVSFFMTPICHPMPVLITTISTGISGIAMNMAKYMVVAIPTGFAIFVLLFLWLRFAAKPDISRFDNFDFNKIDAMRPGKMSAREKWISVIIAITIFFMVIPGFISLLAPASGLNMMLKRLGDHAVILIGIVALAIIKVEGRPLLDLHSAMQKVDWVPVVLLAGTTMVTVAMAEKTTGIPDYISSNVLPLVQGMNPFLIVIIIGILCCILTNFMMNSGVGVMCALVGTMIAMETGINPSLMAVAVCVGANCAYLIPSAMAPIGIAYTSPWCDGKTVFKNGLAAMLFSVIAMAAILFPLGNIVF